MTLWSSSTTWLSHMEGHEYYIVTELVIFANYVQLHIQTLFCTPFDLFYMYGSVNET